MLELTSRQRFTFIEHLFKAIFKSYHHPMRKLLKKYIPQNGVVIDVGWHAGQFTKIFSKLAHQGCVYTFEPGDYAYSILKTDTFPDGDYFFIPSAHVL